MRFHQFDRQPTLAPRMTIAQFERLYRAPLLLRAQCCTQYQIFRGRA